MHGPCLNQVMLIFPSTQRKNIACLALGTRSARPGRCRTTAKPLRPRGDPGGSPRPGGASLIPSRRSERAPRAPAPRRPASHTRDGATSPHRRPSVLGCERRVPGAQHRPADRPCTRRRVGLRLAWMGHRRRGPCLAAPPREPARGVESTFPSHRHIYISFFYPSSHRLHKHLHSHALAEVASFLTEILIRISV